MRMTYKHALRAKGIKPVRAPAHTPKLPGHYELLPVRGVHIHPVRPEPEPVCFESSGNYGLAI